MKDEDTQQRIITEASPAQRVIPPYLHFPIERVMFIIAILCMIASFPVLIFGESIRTIPFGFLCFVMLGIGIILLALTITIAEIDFRHNAVSTIAIVTRERRLVENYFTQNPPQTSGKKSSKRYTTKVMTIEVQFTTQMGERIVLEVLANTVASFDIGQPIPIYYIVPNPQVAVIESKSKVQFGLALLYCFTGVAFITAGLTLFR